MKSRLLAAALTIGIVSVALFVGHRLMGIVGELGGVPTIERLWLLGPAAALYGATLLTYGLLWRDILHRLDRVRRPFIDVVSVFCASWLGRYVPSSLPYLAGKLMMGVRLGYGKRSLAASLVYENVLLISVGAATSAILILLTVAGQGVGPIVYLGAGLGGAAGLILLSPRVMYTFTNFAARIAHKSPIAREELLSYRGIAAGAAFAALAHALHGAAFALVLSSFVELDGRELLASVAIYNLAGVAGFLALPVPSGLGVREAVLIGMLQLFVPLEVAAAAAIVARLGGIIIDVVFGLAGGSLFALRQRREDAVHEQPMVAQELEAA